MVAVAASVVAGAEIAQPELWSDTDPNLYRLETHLSWSLVGAEHRARSATVVGIRSVRFDPDQGFFINGEPRLLQGVCLHEDAGPFGKQLPQGAENQRGRDTDHRCIAAKGHHTHRGLIKPR